MLTPLLIGLAVVASVFAAFLVMCCIAVGRAAQAEIDEHEQYIGIGGAAHSHAAEQ